MADTDESYWSSDWSDEPAIPDTSVNPEHIYTAVSLGHPGVHSEGSPAVHEPPTDAPMVCEVVDDQDVTLQRHVSPQTADISQQSTNVSPQAATVCSEPTNVSLQPTNVSPQPTDGSPQPTDGSPQPTDGSPQPTNVSQQPTYVSLQPTDVSPQPPNVSPPPTDVSQQPTDVSQKLTDGFPQSSESIIDPMLSSPGLPQIPAACSEQLQVIREPPLVIPTQSSTNNMFYIPEQQHVTTEDSDDDIPLAEIARRSRKRLWLSEDEIDGISDDSFNDQDYNPLKDGFNSTDTENEDSSKKVNEINKSKSDKKRASPAGCSKTKKLKTKKKRDNEASIQSTENNPMKNDSKAGGNVDESATKIRTSSRNEKLTKNKSDLKSKIQTIIREKQIGRRTKKVTQLSGIERAKKKSLIEAKLQSVISKYHVQRLDNLLASNGLKRNSVKSDGNCFFKAVGKSSNPDNSPDDVRHEVVDHIALNREHYIGYVDSADGSFDDMLLELRTDGHWNTSLADCLPLAVANLYQCCIRIYSSEIENPIQDIHPDINVEGVQTNDSINVARIAIRGKEHYDRVIILNDDSSKSTDNINANEILTNPVTPQKNTSQEIPDVTPHKSAKYKSPKKKAVFRRKQSTPNQWKSNKKKQARNSGNKYISCSGKLVKEKQMQNVSCMKCRYKCSTKINEEERKKIFTTYWELGDYARQRNFICQHVENNPTKGNTTRRATANTYYLPAEGTRMHVCKNFFLKTLDIGQKTVSYALKNKQCGAYVGLDKRGKDAPGNKKADIDIQFIKSHIESFPRMESHYTRKDTKREYLAADLTIRKMFTLYGEKCKACGVTPVAEKKYRDVFCTQYNLSFFHPKKDKCSICTIYETKKAAGTVTDDIQKEYDSHQRRKKESREEKDKDKQSTQMDASFHAATFDLQAVLSCPCTDVGELYYKRKLSCYNLSFYSLGTKSGTCYMWNETQAQRGSCEIATCLLTYINSISSASTSRIKEITFYSDTCSGQNRNQFVTAALLHALRDSNSIEKINQKYFEKGHSQMESDSIHSTIEHAKGKTEIYQPSQWNTVVSMARRKNPRML
ncbi:MAG: hypothetical protein ABW185_13425 [Sedimenticola sp.]